MARQTYKLLSAESFLAPFTFRQVSLSGLRDSIWSPLSVDSVLEKSVCQGIFLLPFVERCHLSLALHKHARCISSFRQESVTKSFVPTYWLVVICQPLSPFTLLFQIGELCLFVSADNFWKGACPKLQIYLSFTQHCHCSTPRAPFNASARQYCLSQVNFFVSYSWHS